VEGLCANENLAILWRHGATIDAKDTKGRTTLHWAIWQSKYSVLEHLFAAKANTKAISQYKWSILTYTAGYGYRKTIGTFAAAKDVEFPNHELRDSCGRTALDVLKWRLSGEDTPSDMERPTLDDIFVFESWYRMISNEQFSSPCGILNSAAKRLQGNDGGRATEMLIALQGRKLPVVACPTPKL
jgi:hypothetical protein